MQLTAINQNATKRGKGGGKRVKRDRDRPRGREWTG